MARGALAKEQIVFDKILKTFDGSFKNLDMTDEFL